MFVAIGCSSVATVGGGGGCTRWGAIGEGGGETVGWGCVVAIVGGGGQ